MSGSKIPLPGREIRQIQLERAAKLARVEPPARAAGLAGRDGVTPFSASRVTGEPLVATVVLLISTVEPADLAFRAALEVHRRR
jgi:hypothetical protein